MTAAFSNTLPDSIEQIIEVFERDWRHEPGMTISDYLPAHLEDTLRRKLLLELIIIDLERRYRSGDPQSVVGYLNKYPEIQHPETVVKLMILEHRIKSETTASEIKGSAIAGAGERVWRHGIGATSNPDAFGRFLRLERIGHGGMGVVFRAHDPRYDRTVAIKLVRNCAATYRKFCHEGEAISRLRHPNIVRVYEVGEHEGIPYLAMELIEGLSLAEWVREKGVLGPDEAARYICEVARAIEYAHRNNVLHRDLAPGNILIDGNQQPQIVDFGLAKFTDSTDDSTRTGMVLGTRGFLPPEQQQNAKLADERSDVYTLGATLRYLLTARKSPPDQVQPVGIPGELRIICEKCVEERPASRYQSASSLADDLQRFLDSKPIQARRPGPFERLWKWARKDPVLATLNIAVILLLIFIVIGGVYFWERVTRLEHSLESSKGDSNSIMGTKS